MGKIEQFVQNMINLCNDDSHGYSQVNRWGPDYDCSSAIITALRQAGFDTGDASYTGNMSSNLCARGWSRLSPGVAKVRGDILLNDVNHVAVYCGNNQLAEFSISETGGISGQPGDQTGRRRMSIHIMIILGIAFFAIPSQIHQIQQLM
ncbi:MAG: peptidoglycan amidohydrolase family protein [Muricomes sp.]